MLHEIPYPKKYFKTHLVQVYPDPYEGMSIYDLANKGLQWYNEEHYSNDPSTRPIYKILKRIIQIF